MRSIASMKSWLRKASLTTDDFNPAVSPNTQGGFLANEQAANFLRVAIAESTLMAQCRQEFSNSVSFEVPRISFATRVLKKGTEGSRLATAKQAKPATGLVTLTANLFKGEVQISEETFEDQVEREGLADTIVEMIAQAVGRDLEEYALLNNTVRATPGDDAGGYAEELDVFNGLVYQAVGQAENSTTGRVVAAAQAIADASTYTSFPSLFAAMLEKMPSQYRRPGLKFFTSIKLADRYAQSLGLRGTPLGDAALMTKIPLSYQGIPVEGIPMLTGSHTINSAAMVYDNVCFLTNPQNIIFGFHRRVRLRRWEEPREGCVYFLPSVRMDAKFADPNGIVSAKIISGL